MLELNSKPKKLEIQRHTKSGNWMTEVVITRPEGDNRTFTEEEIYYWYETFEIPTDDNFDDEHIHNIRVVNEYNKVILSRASHDFLIRAGRASHIIVYYPLDDICVPYSRINPVMQHVREFQRYIGRQGGIKNIIQKSVDAEDGYIQTYTVNFKNGTYVTVSVYPVIDPNYQYMR